MGKRKQILHLQNDEVAVVFPKDYWRHMVDTYKTLAEEAQDSGEFEAWMNMANHVNLAIEESNVNEWDE